MKLPVVSARPKKAINAFLQRGRFFGEGCLRRTIAADLHGEIDRAFQISLDCERRARFAHSSETRSLQRCLSKTCSRELFESRKTGWINSSFSVKGDWLGFWAAGYFHFVKIHRTLRMSPAMAAGVSDRLWDVNDLVALWEAI